MFSLLIVWLCSAAGFMVASALLRPNFVVKGGFGSALWVAMLAGVANLLLGWVVKLVLVIGTLGLALLMGFLLRWVALALVLKLVDAFSDRLRIKGFLPALLGAGIISIATGFGEFLTR
jgi:putative membrane protein